MASMQAELNGAKRVPKTNAKKCMQNRFPNSGPPLYAQRERCTNSAANRLYCISDRHHS